MSKVAILCQRYQIRHFKSFSNSVKSHLVFLVNWLVLLQEQDGGGQYLFSCSLWAEDSFFLWALNVCHFEWPLKKKDKNTTTEKRSSYDLTHFETGATLISKKLMDFSLQFPSSSSNTNPRQKALILIRLVSSTISMDFWIVYSISFLRAAIDKR